ncbi:hypothetical protein HKX48_004539 [Thoreauomyces humboldtii]|nr:hypothetical protein HKX48_004539 [Thoreauomyces humboldtii]
MSLLKLLYPRVLAAIKATSAAAAEIPHIADCAFIPSGGPRAGSDIRVQGLLQAAMRLNLDPRQFASDIITNLDINTIGVASVDGPGFVTIKLDDTWLSKRLEQTFWSGDKRLGAEEQKERIVIDYSSPNLAKEMHVGHLRSTIIGDALARCHGFVGADVIRQNHVGDWGTQFGMLIAHVYDSEDVDLQQLQGLEQLYVAAKVRFDNEPEFMERARNYVVKLQSGDPDMLKKWEEIVDVSLRHAQELYDTLNVLLKREDVCGESFYNHDLNNVVSDLDKTGLLLVDQGAKVVLTPMYQKDFGKNKPIFMVEKGNGGFGYAATDLAAIRHRVRNLQGKRLLYVIDNRQSLHCRQLFDVASRGGFLPEDVSAVHVGFGTMMGKDKKPFKTRTGGTVKLAELISSAQERAAVLAGEKNAKRPEGDRFSEAELKDIGNKVGVGAVKYADLSKNRDKDYIFDLESMLQFEGNTAPYLMYAYTRARSVARGAAAAATAESDGAIPVAPVNLAQPAEHTLALTLLMFPDELLAVLATSQPHHLCTYLYRLSQAYTKFYDTCPVIRAPDAATRASRLRLCEATADMLRTGLSLLGIQVLETM